MKSSNRPNNALRQDAGVPDLSGKWFWVFAALLLPVFIIGQDHGLWRSSEMRVVEIGREMYVSGNYAVPTLNGEVFLEKPPFMYASVALSFRLWGRVSEGIARIPSTIYALLGVLATMLLGRRIKGEHLGLWAGLVLSTSMLYFFRAHQCSIDILLTACVALTMFFFFRVYEKDKPEYSFLSLLPFYIFATLAFYSKGFIGLVFPGLAVVAFLVWMRDWRAFWRLKLWFGLIIFILLTAPWLLELWRQGQYEYLKIFFIDNHLHRFVKTSESDLGHQTSDWYLYFEIIWKFFNPWSLLLLPAGAVFFSKGFRDKFSPEGIKLILCWFISGMLFLTVSSTKREVYLLPVFPPAALAVAAWFEHRAISEAGQSWERLVDWGLALALLAMSVGFPVYCAIDKQAGSLWALSLIPPAILVSGLGCYFLFKKNGPKFYSISLASVWVLALASAIFYVPIISAGDDASHFCRRVNELTRESAVFYSVKPEEKDWGYIGFYTGKRIEDLREMDSLDSLVHSETPVFVVMVAHNSKHIDKYENYVRERGARLELVLSEPIAERMSALWRLLPAEQEGGSDL